MLGIEIGESDGTVDGALLGVKYCTADGDPVGALFSMELGAHNETADGAPLGDVAVSVIRAWYTQFGIDLGAEDGTLESALLANDCFFCCALINAP